MAAQHNGAADALVRVLLPVRTEADGDERAAAVADHDRNRQRNDRQRIDDGVRRIAIGAQIAGIGNDDLINDVVERSHQQRNHAGNGILPHEFTNALRSKN